MHLDVIIPTFNRQNLLGGAMASLFRARVPDGLTVAVTVVDNNSSDGTRQLVRDLETRFPGRLRYLFELKQGRSHAINCGIVATQGEIVGMIDDDEEIDPSWFLRVYHAFQRGDVDFIGGPYVPVWETDPPPWLPADYPGVIGRIDGGNRMVAYDDSYPGILMGGNAVIRRAMLTKVGLYSTELGRTGSRLLAGEDEDMYRRLLAAGARGLYLPDMVIYHHVPSERLTKRYYRRWCFWRGTSCGWIAKTGSQECALLAGVPRWLYGKAAKGMLRNIRGTFQRRSAAESFSDELAMWDLAGFFFGRHFYRPR
jgi:glycosyltransferase involved in cell wall biosynthesis